MQLLYLPYLVPEMEVEDVRSNDDEDALDSGGGNAAIIPTLDGNTTTAATVELINHVAYNYVALFIVAVGIIGNLLNLIVLTRPKLKGVMYVYLLGLAVSNLCVLIIAIPALIAITSPQCSKAYAKAYFQVMEIDRANLRKHNIFDDHYFIL